MDEVRVYLYAKRSEAHSPADHVVSGRAAAAADLAT